MSSGAYIVTAGTYHKEHLFTGRERLDYFQDLLLETADELGWRIEAWAIFANHYHYIGHSDEGSADLSKLTNRLHGVSSHWLNQLDGSQGRKVWFSFWQTKLTYSRSYIARLNYVRTNPIRHGLVKDCLDYPWCSAQWFEDMASLPGTER